MSSPNPTNDNEKHVLPLTAWQTPDGKMHYPNSSCCDTHAPRPTNHNELTKRFVLEAYGLGRARGDIPDVLGSDEAKAAITRYAAEEIGKAAELAPKDAGGNPTDELGAYLIDRYYQLLADYQEQCLRLRGEATNGGNISRVSDSTKHYWCVCPSDGFNPDCPASLHR